VEVAGGRRSESNAWFHNEVLNSCFYLVLVVLNHSEQI
jgi:hypothetical protein